MICYIIESKLVYAENRRRAISRPLKLNQKQLHSIKQGCGAGQQEKGYCWEPSKQRLLVFGGD